MYSVSAPVDSSRALAAAAADDAPAALVGFPLVAPPFAFPFAGAASGLGSGFVLPSSARERVCDRQIYSKPFGTSNMDRPDKIAIKNT